MSRLIAKTGVATATALLAVITLFGATAAAQYPPVTPAPADVPVDQILDLVRLQAGSNASIGSVTPNPDGSFRVVVNFDGDVKPSIVLNITVEVNPVVYNGPVPASKSLAFDAPCGSVVTITYSLVNGGKLVERIPVGSAAACAPAAVPVPNQQLAFTGNEVSLPITAGAILIGSGGLMLLAANRRNRKDA